MTKDQSVPGSEQEGLLCQGLTWEPALPRTLLSESIPKTRGFNFHMVGDVSSLHHLEKAIWMIVQPHSSVSAPVWSRPVPWGCIYSLLCWAAEQLCAKWRILPLLSWISGKV